MNVPWKATVGKIIPKSLTLINVHLLSEKPICKKTQRKINDYIIERVLRIGPIGKTYK